MAVGIRAPTPEFHEPFPEELLAPYKNPHTQLRAALEAKLRALEESPVPAMFSPEEQAQRSGKLQRDRMYGEMGLLSRDPGIGAVAKPLLAEAIQASQKRQTDHGEFDPVTGEFREFPSYRRQRTADQLTRDVQATATRESEADQRWQTHRQTAYDRWADRRQSAAEKYAADRASAEERAALAKTLKAMTAAAGNQPGAYSHAGTDPTTGEPVWSHSKELGMFKPDPITGKPTRFTGAVAQKDPGTTSGALDQAATSVTSIEAMQDVQKRLKAVPGGWRTELSTGVLPGALAASGRAGQALIEKVAPKELNDARQVLTDTVGQIRAGRFGLTLTPSEAADSVQYLPSQFDDLPRIIEKAEGLEKILTRGYNRWRETRTRPGFQAPGLPPPTPGGGPAPTNAAPSPAPRKFEIIRE